MAVLKWLFGRPPGRPQSRESFDYSMRAGQARIEIFDDDGHTAYVTYVPREAILCWPHLAVSLPEKRQPACVAEGLAA